MLVRHLLVIGFTFLILLWLSRSSDWWTHAPDWISPLYWSPSRCQDAVDAGITSRLEFSARWDFEGSPSVGAPSWKNMNPWMCRGFPIKLIRWTFTISMDSGWQKLKFALSKTGRSIVKHTQRTCLVRIHNLALPCPDKGWGANGDDFSVSVVGRCFKSLRTSWQPWRFLIGFRFLSYTLYLDLISRSSEHVRECSQ